MMFVNYGMTFSLPDIGYSIYINGMISGLGELSAYLVMPIFLTKIARKKACITTSFIQCFVCILFQFFPIPVDCTD